MMIFDEFMTRIKLCYLKKHGLKIGKNTYVGRNVYIDVGNCNLITIGDNVMITNDCKILAHDASTKLVLGYTKFGKVKIGDNCFIGIGSIILPGSVIGNNCIIGAGSIVRGVFPSDSIIAGNPAKVIDTLSNFRRKHENRIHIQGKKTKKEAIKDVDIFPIVYGQSV